MENIIKVESFNRANTENAFWYVMTEDDLKKIPKPSFGTRAYIITTQKQKVYGAYATNNNFWYDMPLNL